MTRRMDGTWMLAAAVVALAGCGTRDEGERARSATPAVSSSTPPSPLPPATPIAAAAARPAGMRSCGDELGAPAAAKRVAVCRSVSPATHPPCNAANSCALIEDEIARSCALFAGDGPPMPGCGPDPTGTQAAADVIRRYYAAIDARDYATAWAQWGDGGRPGQSFAAFQRGFADTRSVSVRIGTPPPAEGAAGSTYQTVPVTVDATLPDGRRQRFTGRYVVRHVNAIDGATAAQRRWHLDSATLTPAKG